MKDRTYTDIICKGFCSYFSEGKEELFCGCYQFLRQNFTSKELSLLSVSLGKSNDRQFQQENINTSSDDEIKRTACSKCDFLVGGCDFAENRSGPPCGGYIVLNSLLAKQ